MSAYLSWPGAELDEAVWQGIRFLSLDKPTADVTVVTVHLARPASAMTAESVKVEGGRRITLKTPKITVVDGTQTVDVEFTGTLDESGHYIFGDHSPYTVRLVNGGDDKVHPFFAEAQFSFYVDCETGDCHPKGLLPNATPPQPPSIDARYKDFRGFMRMLSEWVRVTNPDWADLAPASQERMLLELLAHHGDMLSYYQDRVANEAFVATASQRFSLRQHATLLGYPVFEGEAARTMLAFETAQPGFVSAGVSFENRRMHGERPVVFYVRERTRIGPANNSAELIVAAWSGASSASIPAGSSELLLWGHNSSLLSGMPFAFVQGDLARIVRITKVELVDLPGWVADPTQPLVLPLQDEPLTKITFDPPLDAELRPWSAETPLKLYANLAEASHGSFKRSWINPAPAPAVGNPTPSQHDLKLELNTHNSIVVATPRGNAKVWLLRAVEVPEGPVIHERDEAGNSIPVFELRVSGQLWSREENLHGSESFDTHYVAVTDNSGRLWLQFGDGVRGHEIEVDSITGTPLSELRMDYRIGEPLDGNCARDTLTEPVQPIDAGFSTLGVTSIANVQAGAGGKRKHTLSEIREKIPISLKHGELRRAVALEDYAAVALTVKGVSRAAAKALDGPFNTVVVLIDADDEAALSEELKDEVWEKIEQTRMAGREHFVSAAEYVPLRVELIMCVEPGFLRHEVRDRVLAELQPGSDEQQGYFHPDKLTFGQDLESGDLIAFVQRIPGVRSVKVTAFCRLDAPPITLGPPPQYPVEDIIDLGPTEVARLDADEDFPENGVLKLSVVGLDTVDESVYETEIAEEGETP